MEDEQSMIHINTYTYNYYQGGQDFDNNPQLLTFNSTVTTVQATILIIPDTQIEPASESFTVMLQLVPPSDQLNVILNPNMTRIMILDDDRKNIIATTF